jgi:phosphoribosylaminoimidazole-succinocarboxamide synthase
MDASLLNHYHIKSLRSGKVRDIYEWRDELWLIASDRISAFDVILPTLIPGKGIILTQMSKRWFQLTETICPNHVISFDLPQEIDLPQWKGRITRCRKAKVIPVECVARGYIAGSGWKEYQACGTVGGFPLPAGLPECARLPEPLFTPATKAEEGHDVNLSAEEAKKILGDDLYRQLREITLKLYDFGSHYAQRRGIILADTKFELGWIDGKIVIIDEILTPDSSRYWPADQYQPGKPQPSFDKQFLREYLETLDWNKTPPGPELPPDIVAKIKAKYEEALTRLAS